jgi:co-chaperonin GroES (HSP10)
MNLIPVKDRFLVSAPSEWNDEIQGKHGIVGVAAVNNIDRSEGAQRWGIVVAIPLGLSDCFKDREPIQVGDKLYLHFNAIWEETRVQFCEEQPLWSIHVEDIFCIVRDGKIIMYGDRVFCEPIYDDDVVVEDNLRVRKSRSGLITEINVGHNLRKARVAHVNRDCAAQVGEVVIYEKDADFENIVEGKTYFCMCNEDILFRQR